MSVDDQLYKDDGTLITKIDIAILIFARTLAGQMIKEDDESYDRALTTMLRVAALMIAPVMTLNFKLGPPLLIAAVSFLYAAALLFLSFDERCDGRGSTIDHGMKWLGLFALTITVSLCIAGFFAGPLDLLPTLRVSAILYFATSTIVVFTMLYVKRLGTPPPKKQKAKSLKLALHH